MTDPVSRLGEIRADLQLSLPAWAAASNDEPAVRVLRSVGWLLEHVEQLQRDRDHWGERGDCDDCGAVDMLLVWTDEGGDSECIACNGRRRDELWHRWDEMRAQRQAVLDLCNAADEAELKPAIKGYEPLEVPWTLAIRKTLGADDDR